MPAKFVHGLRAFCVAVALVLATAHAAEPKEASSPVGLTREQVIARYGEPRSQIAAGNRTVMFFAKERFILRDGVVVEVERIAPEPASRRPAPVSVIPPAPVPTTAEAAPAGATPVVPAQAAPAPTAAPRVAAPVPSQPVAPAASAPVTVAVQPATSAAPADAADSGEAKLEIKSVRPASGSYQRSSPKQETSTAAAPGAPGSTSARAPSSASTVTSTTGASAPATSDGPEPKSAPASTTATPGTLPAPSASAPASSGAAPVASPAEATASTPAPAAETAGETQKEEDALAAAKAAKEKKLKLAQARRRLADASTPDAPNLGEALLTGRTLVVGFIVIVGGVGYLVWRSRQRQLELAATAVSQTPFVSPTTTAGGGGSAFTPDLLAKLEWKRFEELVAAYYVKTGVVAVRTKNGPANPVHIKISWKGESRPFAYVRCIPHPTGLVDAAPLHELGAALAAEDIRRGYVVTTGKFNVNARDYAEDKHLTLLTGDIFLEKLNALPEAARAEIMQAVTSGDYQTPSCPKCEARMVRSGDDPSVWRCPNHADQVIPAWR